MTYSPLDVSVDEKQNHKLRKAIEEKKALSIKVFVGKNLEPKTVLFTPSQILKIERAKLIGKNNVTVRMSRKQVQANTNHNGGFLWGLVSRLAPAVVGGIASGLASKAFSGDGVYFQKKGLCAKLEPVKGGGLYLTPHPNLAVGDGLFVSDNTKIKQGRGLLLGENSPFKNIPILNLLL